MMSSKSKEWSRGVENETLNESRSVQLQPTMDFANYARAYAREKPEVVALWCFGIGFILGWKLKPW